MPLLAAALLLRLAAATPARAAEAAAPLRLVDLATRAPDAKALDGSSTHFYYGPASSSARNRTWVFYMEGGGDCTDEASCAAIAKSGEGSGKNARPTMVASAPLLLQDADANPRLHDANHVYVPYMTGDFHAGQRCADAGRYAGKYWFCGHRHLEATVDTLLKEHHLGEADLVVFSGCSTGGMGVFRNIDWVTAKLKTTAPRATVLGAAFSGFYFYQNPFTGPGSVAVQDFSAAGFEQYYAMHTAYVDESCENALAKKGEAWRCQQAIVSESYISTPIFVSEEQTDKVVMGHHSGVTPPTTWVTNPAMAAYAADWRRNMTQGLAAFARKPMRGVFSPACWNHCGNRHGHPKIDGVDVISAFGTWADRVLARSGNGSVVHVDGCKTSPCNPTCSGPLAGAIGASAVTTGLRATYFNNSVLLGPLCGGGVEAAPASLHIDAAALAAKCGGGLSPTLFSARYHGQLQLPPGQYQMKVGTNGALRLWVHGWKLVDEFTATSPQQQSETIGKYNFTVVEGSLYPIRLDVLFTSLPATVAISFREVGSPAWKPLPATAFVPTVSEGEQQRQDLQTGLATGWNTWHRASALAHVHLPTAFGFDMTIVDPAMNTTFSKGIVDRCDPEHGKPCLVPSCSHAGRALVFTASCSLSASFSRVHRQAVPRAPGRPHLQRILHPHGSARSRGLEHRGQVGPHRRLRGQQHSGPADGKPQRGGLAGRRRPASSAGGGAFLLRLRPADGLGRGPMRLCDGRSRRQEPRRLPDRIAARLPACDWRHGCALWVVHWPRRHHGRGLVVGLSRGGVRIQSCFHLRGLPGDNCHR